MRGQRNGRSVCPCFCFGPCKLKNEPVLWLCCVLLKPGFQVFKENRRYIMYYFKDKRYIFKLLKWDPATRLTHSTTICSALCTLPECRRLRFYTPRPAHAPFFSVIGRQGQTYIFDFSMCVYQSLWCILWVLHARYNRFSPCRFFPISKYYNEIIFLSSNLPYFFSYWTRFRLLRGQ